MKQCISCLSEGVTNVVENNCIFYHCPACNAKNTRCIEYGTDFLSEVHGGHQVHVSIAALIRDKDGKILLINRKDFPFGLAIPVGHVFENEKLENAIKRKVMEETGFVVKKVKKIGQETIVDHCKYGTHFHQWNVFDCNVQGTSNPNYESGEVVWKLLSELDDCNLTDQSRYILSKLGLLNKKYIEKLRLDFDENMQAIKPKSLSSELALLHSLPLPVLVYSGRGKLLQMNIYAEKLLGVDKVHQDKAFKLLERLAKKAHDLQKKVAEQSQICGKRSCLVIANPIHSEGDNQVSITIKRMDNREEDSSTQDLVYTTSQLFNASDSNKIIINSVLRQIIFFLKASSCSIFSSEEDNGKDPLELIYRISGRGAGGIERKKQELKLAKEFSQINNIEIKNINIRLNAKLQHQMIAVPLVQGRRRAGVLIIIKEKSDFITEQQAKLLPSIASRITGILESEKLYQKLVYERNMHRKIMSITTNGVILLDKKLQPIFLNKQAQRIVEVDKFDITKHIIAKKSVFRDIILSGKTRTYFYELSSPYRCFKFVISPIIDRKSGNNEILIVVSDITEQKLYELSLSAENEKILKIINNTNEGILVFDQSFKIVLKNEAMKLADKFVNDRDFERRLSKFAKMIKDNSRNLDGYQEIVLKDLDGDDYWLGVTFSTLDLDQKEMTIAFTRDIMAEKFLDIKQNNFIYTVTHELRTPITAIKGYLSMILGGDAGEIQPKQRRFFDKTNEATDRLINLVEGILASAKIEDEIFHKKRFDPNQILADMALDFRQKAKQKNIKIVVKKSKDKIGLIGDYEKTRQAIANLVDNAIKYTDKGQIKLSVSAKVARGEIIVEDSGVGLTHKESGLVFDKFYRSNNRLVNEPGTGLGLYIVKNIIEKQNGEISVQSKPGKGTRFTIALPLANKQIKKGTK